MNDYSKLRPDQHIEQCECARISGLVLVYLFTRNPINCFACRNEVDPERLGLATHEVEEIASGMRVFASLYDLWLDSGEYEAFAKEKLTDPKGQVNQKGMAIARLLSTRWPSYYQWFYHTADGTPERCPSCGSQLDCDVRWGTGKCDRCRIVL